MQDNEQVPMYRYIQLFTHVPQTAIEHLQSETGLNSQQSTYYLQVPTYLLSTVLYEGEGLMLIARVYGTLPATYRSIGGNSTQKQFEQCIVDWQTVLQVTLVSMNDGKPQDINMTVCCLQSSTTRLNALIYRDNTLI